MNKEKITVWAHFCILAATVCIAAYIGIKFLLPVILPFLIAWSVAFMTRRPADFMAEKLHMPRKLWRAFLSLAVMLFTVGGAIYTVIKVAGEAFNFLNSITSDGKFIDMLNRGLDYILGFFGNASQSAELEEKIAEAALNFITGLLGDAASVVGSAAGAVPGIVLFILITAISTVYFAIDLENVNKYIHSVLPKRANDWLMKFKSSSVKVLIKYIRSYLLIMLMTFAVMFFGLSLIGVKYALLMALIIAVLDLLPVIGIGTVLIPWGIFMLIAGESRIGIGLLILYGFGMILRQIIEPRIVGKELGIHPLLTLVLMYVGYSFLGLFGLLLIPVFTVILESFFKKESASEIEK